MTRVVWAFIFGLGTAATALGTMKGPFELPQWAGLVGIFLLTAYGKYSTNTDLIGPDRKPWTEDQRRDAGLPANPPAT